MTHSPEKTKAQKKNEASNLVRQLRMILNMEKLSLLKMDRLLQEGKFQEARNYFITPLKYMATCFDILEELEWELTPEAIKELSPR